MLNVDRDNHINTQLKARGLPLANSLETGFNDISTLNYLIDCFYELYTDVNANGVIPHSVIVAYFKFHGVTKYYLVTLYIKCIKDLEIVYNNYRKTQEKLSTK